MKFFRSFTVISTFFLSTIDYRQFHRKLVIKRRHCIVFYWLYWPADRLTGVIIQLTDSSDVTIKLTDLNNV